MQLPFTVTVTTSYGRYLLHTKILLKPTALLHNMHPLPNLSDSTPSGQKKPLYLRIFVDNFFVSQKEIYKKHSLFYHLKNNLAILHF